MISISAIVSGVKTFITSILSLKSSRKYAFNWNCSNSSVLGLNNILNPYEKKIDYSNIIKIKNINGFDFYKSKNWKCYDFRSICVNSVKEKYDIKRKYGYLIFKTD